MGEGIGLPFTNRGLVVFSPLLVRSVRRSVRARAVGSTCMCTHAVCVWFAPHAVYAVGSPHRTRAIGSVLLVVAGSPRAGAPKSRLSARGFGSPLAREWLTPAGARRIAIAY